MSKVADRQLYQNWITAHESSKYFETSLKTNY